MKPMECMNCTHYKWERVQRAFFGRCKKHDRATSPIYVACEDYKEGETKTWDTLHTDN